MKKLWILALALSAAPYLALADDSGDLKPPARPTPDAEFLGKAALTPQLTPARPKGHSLSSTAGANVEMHSAFATVVSFSGDGKTVTLDHDAFADGFGGAGQASYAILSPLAAKKFKVGDRVHFTLQKINGAFVIWFMRRAGN
jgi:Cu/Ag efflux protein CusF